MSGWRPVEIYGTFVRITGEVELTGSERFSDTVNRVGSFLHVRGARSEPLSVNLPVLSRAEPMVAVSKAAITLVCPLHEIREGNPAMWRDTIAYAAAFNTAAFTMVGDVHLAPGHNLEDHLQRHPGDFLPVTNVSALWIANIGGELESLQRPFALVNPATMLSFTLR
ncbi:MAG: DUF6812 domain-containing protein [Candidatus Dormibacteria bacterium]